MRRLAQARNPYSRRAWPLGHSRDPKRASFIFRECGKPHARSWLWIPGSLAEPVIGPAGGRTCWLAPGMTALDCRLHRRPDQLDGVVAAPFRRAGNGADFAALTVHQHRGRHPQRAAYLLKILE